MVYLLLLLMTAALPVVRVDGERVVLGDLLPNTPQPWSQVDIGPAPLPLHSRRISKKYIARQVALAQLAPLPGVGVRNVQVYRPGQTIAQPALTAMVQEELRRVLPPTVTLHSVLMNSGVVLVPGPVTVQLELPRDYLTGRQTIFANLQAGGSRPVRLAAQVDVSVQRQTRTPAVVRQQEVALVIRQGAVQVHSLGVAQQAGSVGDSITVMPSQGVRLVRGIVVDAHTVEVRL